MIERIAEAAFAPAAEHVAQGRIPGAVLGVVVVWASAGPAVSSSIRDSVARIVGLAPWQKLPPGLC